MLSVSKTWAAQPIVGTWTWFNGIEVKIHANKSVQLAGTKKSGTWHAGSYKYKNNTYGYKIVWDVGDDGKPHVDYLNLVKDGKRLEGINTEGIEVSGEKK